MTWKNRFYFDTREGCDCWTRIDGVSMGVGLRLTMVTRILFVLALGEGLLAAQTDGPAGFYRGMLGNEKVNVCFGKDTAEYYSEESRKTMQLEAIADQPGVFLESEPSHPKFVEDFDPQNDSAWNVTVSAGSITGIWKPAKSTHEESRAISLIQVSGGCDPAYESQRLGLAFAKKNSKNIGRIIVDILVHPATGVESVGIASGLPQPAADRINTQLAEEAKNLNGTWVECSEWEGRITPRYVSPLWMVFDVTTSGFCGGPHPNEESYALTYLSQTGKPIDFEQWIDHRYWSEAALGKLRQALVRKMDNEDCSDHQDDLEWKEFQPWMGGEGFFFRLSEVDRAYKACEGDYMLSFREMRQFIDKSILETYDHFVAVAQSTPSK